jgi:protein-S-isoprenylcysteine O-methyltransferase Ste14
MTTGANLNRRVAQAAVFLERYALSLAFLAMAGVRLHHLIALDPAERAAIAAAPLVEVLRQVIWVQLYIYVGLMLLLGRRVTVPPRSFADLILPLATTFFNLAYSAVPAFPAGLTASLCPPGWQVAGAVAGFMLNLAGLLISIWAAVCLGRSFSVWIEVRKVVLEGAYRRVRHPMYLGYLCFLAGVALANFSAAYLGLVILHTALLLYRARLEEKRLAEASPEYQEYCKHSGFIFPRFR